MAPTVCPACDSKRVHSLEEWLHHPYRAHGFNGSHWTRPKIVPLNVTDAGAANPRNGGTLGGVEPSRKLEAAPVGEFSWITTSNTGVQGG